MEKLQGTLDWLDHDVVGGLRTRVPDLERQLGLGGRALAILRAQSRRMRVARKTDLYIQQQTQWPQRLARALSLRSH